MVTLDKKPIHKEVYSLPIISIFIALPYFGLCLVNNFAFSIPYVLGIFWFGFICPAVVLIRLLQTLYIYVKKKYYSYPIHKIILLLLPAYLLFGLGLIYYGCAVSA